MALEERITVSDLMRKRLFKKAPLIDAAISHQFAEETAKTLFKLNKYIKDTSQQSEINSLLTEIKSELKEIRALIDDCSNSQ